MLLSEKDLATILNNLHSRDSQNKFQNDSQDDSQEKFHNNSHNNLRDEKETAVDFLNSLKSETPVEILDLETHIQQKVITLEKINTALNAYIAYCVRGLNLFSIDKFENAVQKNKTAVLELLSFFLRKFFISNSDSKIDAKDINDTKVDTKDSKINSNKVINRDKSISNFSNGFDSQFSFSKEQCDELNLLMNCINATLRTNFFCYAWSDNDNENDNDNDVDSFNTKYFNSDQSKSQQSNSHSQRYLSFKFDSKSIRENSNLMFETFIFSEKMEGIHMRSSFVSRGGIRWSSRINDYSLEVHDLVTAQIQKNAAIIPSGSKGGFIFKGEQTKENSLMAYDTFVRGLLDITDNIVNGVIVSAKNVKAMDEYDTYLVIAADKGTATFSDYANNISISRNYWLGDAFASGGSNGYDHKKIGITSLGTLVASAHHFATMGMNLHQDSITTIGVGGMSGDVFGNAMTILSNIRLVAAFNHSHIFIDPNPNVKESHEERKRLFEKGLSWSAYDVSKISKGGGIFEVAASKIELSNEIQKLLNIDVSYCSGVELVKHILKCNADFLFFGGIGTYVKSSDELHEHARDKFNDVVRVNGCDLRVKVISEGANLAMTRNARIEAARNGVLLNTDALDNFSGVNCSDHEVILKILLSEQSRPQNTGQNDEQNSDSENMNQKKRNDLLRLLQDSVVNMVLEQNESRNLGVLLELMLSNEIWYRENIQFLVDKGLLNKDDFGKYCYDRDADISSDSNFDSSFDGKADSVDRESNEVKSELTRPEICEIVSVCQIYIKNLLLRDKSFFHDAFYDRYLYCYFPGYIIQNRIEFGLSLHPLRAEIIVSELTNKILSSISISFFFYMIRQFGEDNILKIAKFIAIYDEEPRMMSVVYESNKDLIHYPGRILPVKNLHKDLVKNLKDWLNNNK